MAELPNRIRELRKARGWTLQRLGEEVGCSLQWVGELERGDNDLTLSWMRRFAAVLGVKPADLLLPADNSMSLSDEERDLVARIRAAEPAARSQIRAIADVVIPFAAESEDKRRA